jgi:hypothetical protein
MDEFITFVIIWVVLYLVNSFSKKLKQRQPPAKKPAATPAESVGEVQTEPVPSKKEMDLRELFEEFTRERKETKQPAPGYRGEDVYQRDQKYAGEKAYQSHEIDEAKPKVRDQEEILEKEQADLEEDEKLESAPITVTDDTPIKSVLSESLKQLADKKRRKSKYKRRLRQAIIWKEILDKPLSLRFPLQSKNRVS